MPLYTVLSPPPRATEAAADPLRFVFVKDGFAWPALIVPELWMIYRRMWVVLLLYVAVGLGLMYLASRYGGPLPWILLAFVHVLFAFEANQLRRANLGRRGYDFVGVVEGRRSEAELRFFSEWQPPYVAPPPPADAPPSAPIEAGAVEPPKPVEPAKPSAEAGDVVGLFPSPGGRT